MSKKTLVTSYSANVYEITLNREEQISFDIICNNDLKFYGDNGQDLDVDGKVKTIKFKELTYFYNHWYSSGDLLIIRYNKE